MRAIPVVAIPSQTLTVTIDNARYVLTLKVARGVLVCDISINDVVTVLGSRVLAGELLIPYEYRETGNFLVLTVNQELPSYDQLGVTQTLVFLTPAELGEIRQSTTGLYTLTPLYVLTLTDLGVDYVLSLTVDGTDYALTIAG